MNASLRCSRTCHKIPGLYRRFCLSVTQARWMPKLVSIDTQSYAALTSQSLCATIGPSDNWPLFHDVIGISRILSYNRNVTLQALELFSVLSHGSIMLPPRQPCVFARLARWQLGIRIDDKRLIVPGNWFTRLSWDWWRRARTSAHLSDNFAFPTV